MLQETNQTWKDTNFRGIDLGLVSHQESSLFWFIPVMLVQSISSEIVDFSRCQAELFVWDAGI